MVSSLAFLGSLCYNSTKSTLAGRLSPQKAQIAQIIDIKGKKQEIAQKKMENENPKNEVKGKKADFFGGYFAEKKAKKGYFVINERPRYKENGGICQKRADNVSLQKSEGGA